MYEFKMALEYYEKLLKSGTSDYEVFKQIGLCYEKLKDTKSAKEYYEKYLNKAPLSPDTEKLREKVSKMQVSSSQSISDTNEEGFIDKFMKLFGK